MKTTKMDRALFLFAGEFLWQHDCEPQSGSNMTHYRLHLSVSISPTQCGFKRTGALKSVVGSSFSHDVSRKESERESGG